MTRAARLAGAVEALWESHGIVVEIPFWTVLMDRHIEGARRQLGAEGKAIWAEGPSARL